MTASTPMSRRQRLGSPGTGLDADRADDRLALLRMGMLAVFLACVVFAVARLAVTLQTGLPTPWWANAAGAALIALLWGWQRRRPEPRSSIAMHGTALVAAGALVVPIAYGMPSTIWWLSLVGFAVVLIGSPQEAWLWGPGTVAVVLTASLAEPFVQVAGAAGEPPIERLLARVGFTAIVVGLAAGFRRVANERAAKLASTARQLADAAAARSRFLAHASHDIRTPLHGVIAMTELALQGRLDADARAHVAGAHQSARLLLDLLNKLLDLTSAESGATVFEATPFRLRASVAAVLLPFAAEAHAKGLSFLANAEQTLPDARIGDRHRFGQVLLNLVGTAVKETSRGRVSVRLAAGSTAADEVVIEVRATAPPPRPEALQAPDAALGLAIASEIAQRMGGAVAPPAESALGTLWQARLRLALDTGPTAAADDPVGPPADDLLAAPPSPSPAPLPANTTPLHVLVCEDDLFSQRVLHHYLQRLGHTARLTESAEAAVEALGRERFDLLFSDLQLPGMDGFELARRIRAGLIGSSPLTIVATTAHVGVEDRERLLRAGFDAHLPKPFDLATLETMLRNLTTAR